MATEVGCSADTRNRTSIWGHIFNHIPGIRHDLLYKCRIAYPTITVGTSHWYPASLTRDTRESNTVAQKWARASFRTETHIFRQQLRRSVLAMCLIYGDHSFVPPKDWHPIIKNAWGLEDPPTPYEFACNTFMYPRNRFWTGFSYVDPCVRSAFFWYASGAPIYLLQKIFKFPTPEDFLLHAARFLIKMRKTPRFILWMLSSDPTPAIRNPTQAKFCLQVYNPIACKTKKGGQVQSSYHLKKVTDSPYIQAQLRSGKRINPMERIIWRPGIVWESMAQKLIWRESNESNAVWNRYWQTVIRTLTVDSPVGYYSDVYPHVSFTATPTTMEEAQAARAIKYSKPYPTPQAKVTPDHQ